MRTNRLLTRLEALTDGVYAIGMTLLVFGLAVPSATLIHNEADLLVALHKLVVPIISYALSFLILTSFWLGHALQLELLVRSTRGHAHVNGAVLLVMSLLPFSSGVLGNYADTHLGLQVYGGNLVLAQAALAIHWWFVSSYNHLVKGSIQPERIRAIGHRLWIGMGLNGVGLGLAFFWPLGAALAYFGTYLYYVIEHLRHRVR